MDRTVVVLDCFTAVTFFVPLGALFSVAHLLRVPASPGVVGDTSYVVMGDSVMQLVGVEVLLVAAVDVREGRGKRGGVEWRDINFDGPAVPTNETLDL